MLYFRFCIDSVPNVLYQIQREFACPKTTPSNFVPKCLTSVSPVNYLKFKSDRLINHRNITLELPFLCYPKQTEKYLLQIYGFVYPQC